MSEAEKGRGEGEPLLETKGLGSGYHPLQVLWDVSLQVFDNEAVVLLGANGAGKTTLLKTLVSILPLMAGEIRFRSADVSHLRTDQKVRRGIAFMSEQGIFPDLSVDANLRMGGYTVPASDVRARRREMYELFPDLASRKREPGGSLSGGQRKMLGFAKALIQRPSLLLLDEPSAGLSPRLVTEIIQSLERFHERGLALLIAEQNIQFLDVAERGYVLDDGRIIASGTVDELRENDVVRRAYFGIED
jgi:branched-chain amino acid transport system ATP-binding protein